jgi:gliding motility-associated-like protein
MKAAPDGSKLALAIFGLGVVEIFDFDNTTGQVDNPRTSLPQFDYAFGIEFSPDASKLYITTTPDRKVPLLDSYIIQLDLNQSNPFFPNDTIYSSNDSIFGAIQLGPDGHMYATQFIDILIGSEHVSVIENPDRPGQNCNFEETGLYLAGRSATAGLPNFMQSYMDIPAFTYENRCFGDTTILTITNYSNIDSQLWNFDDPESGGNNSSALASPTHIFSAPGEYDVLLAEIFNSQQFPSSEKVVINPLPDIDYLNPDTVFLYPGAKFTLQGGQGYDYYFWYYQSMQNLVGTNQQIIAIDTGTYYLKVVDTLCCYNIDTIVIIPSVIFVPNAFTPNGDGLNEEFMAICLKQGGISDFHMMVYNRWGQLLFESHEIDEGWDGTFNNSLLAPGVYIYKITFKVELDFGVFENVVLKGPLTLLR